ncbi:hypothetical protein [Qingshengfaniella alkalisoli]|uniref:Uncharacterized protein n=1 Tax=Qingshengfaniella alkalisoli TaxID=2599296 RepID=A0A5B8IUI8_9RHOB|nr:hypothetical protein [Qingshengfaniella alkalisoli]QDY68521.1 hypothetical protein FPZ52_02065 [Qingshengfaniella alkalisoli]
MNDERPPIFLERQGYRRRRLVDAWRMLPIFGLLLFLMPLLWGLGNEAEQPGLAVQTIYLFVVWFLLVAFGAVIAIALERHDDRAGGPRRSFDQDGG